ncbi:MAG: lipopolysaccharide biosynthesis protein [Nitriliruptorales bacterium]
MRRPLPFEHEPLPPGDGRGVHLLPDLEVAGEQGRRTFRGALPWAFVMNGGQQAVTLLVSMVLAAVVGPAVYGLVAMANVYIAFLDMLLQQGMVPAIVQRKDLQEAHLDTAFWLVMASGVVLPLSGIALSGWWADVNRMPDLAPVIVALSALLPIRSLVVVQDAILRRAMDFRALAFRTNLSALAGGAVGISMALQGYGVWSLVAQQLTAAATEVLVLWTASRWRPRVRFSVRAARELLSFTSGSALSSMGAFIHTRADALLIGLFFGPTAVGLYRLAAKLVESLKTLAIKTLQAVSLPELSRFQDNPRVFNERFLDIVRFSTWVAAPLFGALALTSGPLVSLLGEEWAGSAAAITALSLVGFSSALGGFSGSILQALGRPHLLAVLTWTAAGLSAGGFAVAGFWLLDANEAQQVLGMAISRVVVVAVLLLTINIAVVMKLTSVRLAQLRRAVGPPLTAGSLIVLMVSAARWLWGAWLTSALADLALTLSLLLVATACSLFVLEPRVRPLVMQTLTALRATKSSALQDRQAGAVPDAARHHPPQVLLPETGPTDVTP